MGEVLPSAHADRLLRDFHAGEVAHFHLSVNTRKQPMEVREPEACYRADAKP